MRDGQVKSRALLNAFAERRLSRQKRLDRRNPICVRRAIQPMSQMANRPLSVTLVAWLFIVAGTVGIAYHIRELDPRQPLANDALLACFVRLLAIVGGAFALRGRNWARWLLVAWLAFHVAISVNEPVKLVMHAVLIAVIAWLLFRRATAGYFQTQRIR